MDAEEKRKSKSNLKTIERLAIIAGEIDPYIAPRYHMRTLRRRLSTLETRIAAREGSDSSLNYDRAERAALAWAVAELDQLLATRRAARTQKHEPIE